MNKKVIFIAILSLVLAIGLASVTFSTEETDMVGDYNNDGDVTEEDAVYLLRHALFGGDAYPLTKSADFTGDGAVDNVDALYLHCYVLYGEWYYPLNPYDEP